MKIGDRVKHISRGPGRVVATKISMRLLKVKFDNTGRRITVKEMHCTLIPAAKKDDRSWEFTVPNSDSINWDLVTSDLTKDNPMQLISIGDRKYIAVHVDLAKRADLKGIGYPVGLTYVDTTNATIFLTPGQFSEWVDWAINVRTAPWPSDSYRPRTVKVIMPNV